MRVIKTGIEHIYIIYNRLIYHPHKEKKLKDYTDYNRSSILKLTKIYYRELV